MAISLFDRKPAPMVRDIKAVRFVLVHLHQFKNAGSTIDHLLRRNFGSGFLEIHAPGEDGVVSMAAIQAQLDANPGLRALSSHHFRYPLQDLADCRLVDICFLRHPVQRIASMFRYYRTSAHDSAAASVARRNDFAAFAEYMVDRQPCNVLNSQTAFLSTSGDYYFPPHDGHLEQARQRLRQIRMLGTVEQFARSVEVAARFLSPIFPGFAWHYETQNATTAPATPTQVDQDMEDLRQRFGSLADFLLRANQLDIALWQSAQAEVDRRASYLRNHAAPA